MAINGNNTIMNMCINIKELNDKHQLNPNNNGIRVIDCCMSVVNDTIGVGGIFSIKVFEETNLYNIQLSDSSWMRIPSYCRILKSNGSFGCIQNGNLVKGDCVQIFCHTGGKITLAIQEIQPTTQRALTYKIRTQRGNYILENGVVVESD